MLNAMKRSRSIALLCLALAALVLVWSKTLMSRPAPVLGVLGSFALVLIVVRHHRFLPRSPRASLQIQSWSMVIFITAVLWLTGKSASPLLNLYLLPIILCALTQGRLVTFLEVGVIAVCEVWLAAATPGVEVASLAYASRAFGELAPFLFVAYLTSALSADVTEAREHIGSMVHTDSLTGLLNLRKFNEVWQREHAASEKADGVYALLTINIDRLEDINDSFGHDGGDSAILLVAQCLQRSIRGTDTAARLGGDEFALLLPGASPQIAEEVVKRVRHNVYKTTLDLRSRMIRCSVSIGVANYPKNGRDMRDLSSIADRNMHRDKELRRAPGTDAPA